MEDVRRINANPDRPKFVMPELPNMMYFAMRYSQVNYPFDLKNYKDPSTGQLGVPEGIYFEHYAHRKIATTTTVDGGPTLGMFYVLTFESVPGFSVLRLATGIS